MHDVRRSGLQRRYRLIGVIGLSLVVAVVAAAAGTAQSTRAAAPVPKKTIGFLELAGASLTQGQITSEFVRAAKALGWNVIVKDAQGDPTKMAAGAQAFVQQGVDAFVGIAIPPAAIQTSLDAFKKKGTPVVNLGGTVQDPAGVVNMQVRVSEAVNGGMLAQQIVDATGGKGNVGEQAYDAQFGVLVRDGVVESVFKNYGLKVVAKHQIDIANLVSDTLSSVRSQLAANPDIDILYSSIDSQLPGMVSVVKALKRTNIKIFAYNTNPENVAALFSYHNATVVDSAYWWTGWVAADALLQYWTNKAPLSTADAAAKYPIPNAIVTYKNMPHGVGNYPFPDVGKIIYAAWKGQGFALKPLGPATVNTLK